MQIVVSPRIHATYDPSVDLPAICIIVSLGGRLIVGAALMGTGGGKIDFFVVAATDDGHH